MAFIYHNENSEDFHTEDCVIRAPTFANSK